MRKTAIEIICALLVLLWVYAAVSKLLDYGTFVSQLEKSPYTTGYGEWIAWAVPAIELLTALFLVTKPGRLAGLYSSFFLLLLFSSYIYTILNYSYYIPCACGGIISKMNWEQHLVFNMAFMILTVTAIILNRKDIRDHPEPALIDT